MHRGYVKLWRKSLESGLLQNAEAWQLMTWCLLKATHKPHKQLVGSSIIELQKGQLIFGRKKAAEELKTTERKIRTCLKLLENFGFLTIKATNKYSVITLINWDVYQASDQQNDQQGDQETTSKRPASDHKQEHKEQKNEEINSQFSLTPDVEPKKKERKKKSYDDDYEKFYSAFPKKAKKAEGQKVWREHKANGKLLPLSVMLQKLKDCSDEEKWSDREKKYVPSVWTWLEQDRYLQQFAELTEDDKSMLASIGTMAAAVKAKMEMERE